MIEFGKTLRLAREAKGYTISQIAETTHLKSAVVEGLENEDFSMIAAPIYGRGFVKLYCEAVDIDPKPLVDEFMAIMNGDHEITIKERPVESAPPVEDAPPPKPDKILPVPEPDLFRQDQVPPPPPPEPVAPTAPEPPPAPEQPQYSRFAAPIRENGVAPHHSFANPRVVVLAALALALVAVLVLGIRSLYRATTSDAVEPATTAEEPKAIAPAPAAKPAAGPAAKSEAKPATNRKLQDIPSLYID